MDILKELETKNSEILAYFKEQMAGIRGGRPSTKLVENIQVDYFGQKMPIKQLASISVVLPREIQISVWDESIVQGVAKAAEAALSVKAGPEGNLIRINLPALSEERRQELIKLTKKETEETKIRVRGQRDEILKKLKKKEDDGSISEDEKFRLKDQIQKSIDKVNEEIERILENKAREINE